MTIETSPPQVSWGHLRTHHPCDDYDDSGEMFALLMKEVWPDESVHWEIIVEFPKEVVVSIDGVPYNP